MKTNIKNTTKLALSSLALVGVLYSAPVQAQSIGPATAYNITVNQIELCKSAACTSPISISSSAKTFDIASVSVGAAINSYASLGRVPKGTTITHVRATISRTIGIEGTTPIGGGVPYACYTDPAGAVGTVTAGAIGTLITVNLGEQTLVVPDEASLAGGTQPPVGTYIAAGLIVVNGAPDMSIILELPTPVTIGDVPPVIDISFETATALMAFDNGGGCMMIPAAPVVNVTVK